MLASISRACGSNAALSNVRKKARLRTWAETLTAILFYPATGDKTLNDCIVCARHNARKTFLAPIAHILLPDSPFRHLMMDHVYMTERVRSYRCVLVIIDRFSRWIEAFPTKGPNAHSAARFLSREVFQRLGFTDTISSDNGPAFVANTMKIALKRLDIKQKFGCVCHPQS